jgi:hypothetical protein
MLYVVGYSGIRSAMEQGMDKTVVNEVAATLEQLRSSGQIGFWILLAVLVALLALGIAAIVYQRIVIARFEATSRATDNLLKSVDVNIKSVEANIKERELAVKERDEARATIYQQFSVIKETNDELRSEITRLREQQQGLAVDINRILVRLILTEDELKWLRSLAEGHPTFTDTKVKRYYEGFKKDILHLRGLGFLKNREGRSGFSDLESVPEGNHDAQEYFIVTDQGRQFLRLLDSTSIQIGAGTT